MDPRISIDINVYPWMSMDIHGCPWMSMDIHGHPCISMDIHGYPWIFMDHPWMVGEEGAKNSDFSMIGRTSQDNLGELRGQSKINFSRISEYFLIFFTFVG